MLASDRGLVLRTHALGETSRIVSLLGFETGRLRLVAHGARARRSRFAASLEPGNEIDFVSSLAPGRELGTLREAVLGRAHLAGAARLEEMGVGLAALELLDRLLPEGAHEPGLGLETAAMLGSLRSAPDRGGVLLLFYGYELRLLGRLGARPDLERCAECGRPAGETGGTLDVRAGVLRCGGCATRRGPGALHLTPESARLFADLSRLGWTDLARRGTTPGERRQVGVALDRLLASHVERYRQPRALSLLQKVDSGRSGPAPSQGSVEFRSMA